VIAMMAIAMVLFLCNTSSVVARQTSSKEQDDAVATARKAASERLAIAPDKFRVVLVSRADWRDSSLGCPERGKVYAPVMTSGFKVTLRESDRDHVVHVAGGRAIVCTSQADARLPAAPRVTSSLTAGEAVRSHVSRTLEIPESRIRILSVKPARPGDSCVPAAPAGSASLVEVRVDAKTLRYYRDDTVIRPCDPERK
jgi:hypothetical protein